MSTRGQWFCLETQVSSGVLRVYQTSGVAPVPRGFLPPEPLGHLMVWASFCSPAASGQSRCSPLSEVHSSPLCAPSLTQALSLAHDLSPVALSMVPPPPGLCTDLTLSPAVSPQLHSEILFCLGKASKFQNS